MEESLAYNWVHYASHPQPRPLLEIKVEPTLDNTTFSLISPPSSPSFPRPVPVDAATFATVNRRRSNTSIASPKRAKPYPILTRELRFRAEDCGAMENQPYENWSPTGVKSGGSRPQFSVELSPSRSSSEGDQQAPTSYTLSNALVSQSLSVPRIEARPHSSSSSMTTSSLTGAMGDTHLTSHSNSPSPIDNSTYNMQGVTWDPSQAHMPLTHAHYGATSAQDPGLPYHDLSSSSGSLPAASYPPYQNFNHNPSPESLSPRSPDFPSSYSDSQQYPFHPVRPQPTIQTRSLVSLNSSEQYGSLPRSSPTSLRPRTSRTAHEQYEEEIQHLRRKVRELELINESARLHQKELETELANQLPTSPHNHGSFNNGHGLPSPILTPSPQSSAFQASWKARTDARIRQFCSLNRAGNALCAWHDSRRERRAYPPRMAPPGRLNCGCTYEEALFEESLSRHGVGSYHPGENVRMDPALRNPLLKILQMRYGYRDGDFERDIATGEWVEGEGHAMWEHKAIAELPNARKK